MTLSIHLDCPNLDPFATSRLKGRLYLATSKPVTIDSPPSPPSSPLTPIAGPLRPRPSFAFIEFSGNEKVNGVPVSLVDDVFRLSANDWVFDHKQQQWQLAFDLPVPCVQDLPITYTPHLHACPQPLDRRIPNDGSQRGLSTVSSQHEQLCPDDLDNHRNRSTSAACSIDYYVTATARLQDCDYRAIVPITLGHDGSHIKEDDDEEDEGLPAKPLSKTCWGMSDHHHWLYELELPQWIDALKPFQVGIRTKSRQQWRAAKDPDTSCMITIHLYEARQIDTQPEVSMTLLTSSHILKNPSTTWSSPCVVPLEMTHLPTSGSLSSPRIDISHHLCVTLNYTSPSLHPQHPLDAVHYHCVVPVLSPICVPKYSDSDRDSGISLKSC
ncbi:hypothetical protein DM01DRAFT_1332773 [Hesseltinella vesiculosa]|uniref:Uncharacterized protein n=1 Tax=Hesseltinella vesiculosa TaxID=101127 RepID=A0A1X2GT21_9FUNG|nr:hypothetical protein DM01DRAFT_1332773 [Hesseltinella vesiculosa]